MITTRHYPDEACYFQYTSARLARLARQKPYEDQCARARVEQSKVYFPKNGRFALHWSSLRVKAHVVSPVLSVLSVLSVLEKHASQHAFWNRFLPWRIPLQGSPV